jgi:hypothetical protein
VSQFTDTYCLAWFHPDGIEFLQLPTNGENDHSEDDNTHFSPMHADDHRMETSEDGTGPFIPVVDGEGSYAMSNENDGLQYGYSRRSNRRSRSPTPLAAYAKGTRRNVRGNKVALQEQDKNKVSCLYQWNGYSQPMDVLRPFGYAPAFVRRSLDQARKVASLKQTTDLAQTSDRQTMEIEPHGADGRPSLSAFSSASSFSARDGRTFFLPFHSIAVRGATYARPEGYCLCWDQDINTLYNILDQSGDSKALLRQQEWENVRRRRNQRRRELQREVLPTVQWSRRRENAQPSDNNNTSSAMVNSAMAPSGILQPCVQFLNSDSRHAVRLFTPPFPEGPVSTPLTVFVVAIATEDGCFFSGLKNKFEMGHLYPATADEMLVERSPITLCAEYQGPFTRIFESVSASSLPPSSSLWDDQDRDNKNQQSLSAVSNFGNRNCNSGYFNSDDSSCDASDFEAANGNPDWKCQCPFTGLGDLGSDVDTGSSDGEGDDGNQDPGHACRGQLGPGSWHCYVAVFDGADSMIRIDGIKEPVTAETPVPPSFKASLDGLTIGSDHTFDMSLCFGQGSDGEGEGAISEIACFKGRLDEQDIQTMESYLMGKHGIEVPHRQHHEIALDDEYARKAQALIAKSWVNYGISNNNNDRAVDLHPVPLRYLARLRQVAWQQINPVTGEVIVVSRIGSRAAANESSEW